MLKHTYLNDQQGQEVKVGYSQKLLKEIQWDKRNEIVLWGNDSVFLYRIMMGEVAS